MPIYYVDKHLKYIFNGDFVDRGNYGVEVMCVLLALHIALPGMKSDDDDNNNGDVDYDDDDDDNNGDDDYDYDG
jgi:hypothetical protein